MEFRILGPLEVVDRDRPIRLGHGNERVLLALLLLRANEIVGTDSLIEELWRGDPPATASKALQVYVSRLRKRLGSEVLLTRPPGYAVVVGPDELDVSRFERLVEEARRADPAEAASKLRDALSLWRGPPLADLADEPFAQAEIVRLEELRLSAVEDRIDADLALGRHAEVVAELESLVARNPYRERQRRQLMLALYRSGRQADALASYRDARRVLANELGLEPSDELKELERQILAHDGALAAPTGTAPTPEGLSVQPVGHRGSVRRWSIAFAIGAVLIATAVAVVLAATRDSAAEQIVATPSSVAVIDPGSNSVVAAIRVGDRPTQIAAHEDAIWVLHPDIRTLSLVSRSERKVMRTVGLGGAPTALVANARGAWVSDAKAATVDLIEPDRLTHVRTIRTRGGNAAAADEPGSLQDPGPYPDAGPLAIGFESLWFASGNRTISRIDLETGRVVTRIHDVDALPGLGGIAIGQGSVWVAGPYQDSMVTRIDPRRNAIVAKILVQVFRLNGIALGGGAVWVSDVGSDQVWAIDPVVNQPSGTTKVGVAPLGVAYGNGSIWIANSGDGTVSRIDPATGRIAATISVGGSPNGIVAADGEIWVTVD